MKKSKFAEAQIAFALKQSEIGIRVEKVFPKMGIPRRRFQLEFSRTGRWTFKYPIVLCSYCQASNIQDAL